MKRILRRRNVSFYLDPSHAWLANAKLVKEDKDEGKFHEYYVTAEIFKKVSKRVASKNSDKSVWLSGEYINGLKNGEWNYSPDGPVDKVEVYNMGKLIKTYFP